MDDAAYGWADPPELDMPDEQPKPAAKKATKKVAKKAAKRSSKDPAKRDADHVEAQAEDAKRIDEVVARTAVYAKQVGPVMKVDRVTKGKDRSGQAKAVTVREEMDPAVFFAKYELATDAGGPDLYVLKG